MKNRLKRVINFVKKSIIVKIGIVLFLVFLLLNNIGTAKDTYLINNKAIVFLTAQDGYNYIEKSDFIKNLSKLDIELRLEKNLSGQALDYCHDLYQKHHKKQFRRWSFVDKRFIIKRLKNTYSKIDSITPNVLPDTLYLIRTSGKQEFKSFYTCKNAIVCPSTIRMSSTYLPMFGYIRNYMERVFIHELFHIYSTNHPKVRDSLYSAIGFERVHCLKLTPEIEKRLISNPDDKPGFYKITLTDKETCSEKIYCLLILSKYNEWRGYVDFPARLNVLIVYLGEGLHQIYKNGECWESVVDNNKPIIKKGKEFQDYFKKVGLDEYSPEEIVAHLFIDLIKSKYDDEFLEKKPTEYKLTLNRLEYILNK